MDTPQFTYYSNMTLELRYCMIENLQRFKGL